MLGALLAAVFIFRLDLASSAARLALASSGLTPTTVRVQEANLRRLVLTEIGAGPGQAVAIRRLSLAYKPSALLQRRIDRVDVEGMVLAVRAGAEGVAVDGFDTVPAGLGETGAGNWAIGEVGLTDANLSVKGAVGAQLTIDGDVQAVGDDGYSGDLRFRGSASLSGTEPAEVEGTLSFAAAAARVEEAELVLAIRSLPLPWLGNADIDATATLKNGEAHTEGEIQTQRGPVAFDVTGTFPAQGDWGALRADGTLEFDLTEVTIGDADFKLSAAGRVQASIEGPSLAVTALEPIEIDIPTSEGPWAIRVEPASAPLLSAEHARGRIRSASIQVAEARVDAVDRSYRITAVEAAIGLQPVPTLQLHSLRLADAGQPPRIPPLTLTGKATLDQTLVPFDATIVTAGGKARTDMKGTWDLGKGSGTADVKLHPLRFIPGTLQPTDLAPAFDLPISDVSGEMAIQGSLRWKDHRLRPNLQVRFTSTNLRLKGTPVRGIASRVRLTDFDPPRTPHDQLITIEHIDAGVPLTKAEMHFQLDARRRLLIERASIQLLDGRASQSDALLDIAKRTYRGTLELTGISLQSLLDISELEGTMASGRVSGRIPILYQRGELAIADGRLETEAPGVLRYRPRRAPEALKEQGEGLGLALQALENFHYDSLSMTANGGSGVGWTSRVQITGKNPDFMEGYPFAFNINLSGDLDRVVLSGLLGMSLPEQIQDRLKRP